MNALMHAHAVRVAAPSGLGGGEGPLILERDDDDFIAAVLNEFGTASGRAKLQSTQAQATAGTCLKLFQPVQRRFHLALIEGRCDSVGTPRLDPSKVEAAGMVIRRVRFDAQGRESHLEGWMKAAGELRGWVPVQRLGAANADPTPAARMARRDTGVAQIDRALRALGAGEDHALLEEQVTPLFVAPPAVCAQAGRSLWYGVVQTTSSELAQGEADLDSVFDGFGPESSAFTSHLVQPLHGMEWTFPEPPEADARLFDAGWMQRLSRTPFMAGTTQYVKPREHEFLQLLRQLAIEFDVFGESAASRALLQELSTIPLEYAALPRQFTRRTIDAASFLQQAVPVLFEQQAGAVELPKKWPALSADARARLLRALSAAMRERFRTVRGRPGRYDEPDAQYVLCAFLRLKPEGGCAARTIWTTRSRNFVIAPWYESAGNPVQIALPDSKSLKSLKPNVAFVLPSALQGLLSGSAEELMKGNGKEGGTGVGWICSFSIPVITFCAFIVLNIFLSLFDLIFRWSLFIKVCIPYPKAKP